MVGGKREDFCLIHPSKNMANARLMRRSGPKGDCLFCNFDLKNKNHQCAMNLGIR